MLYTREMIDFSTYAPQQTFLLQGDEAAAEALVSDLMATDPLVQVLSVPRFTIDHARSVASFAAERSNEPRTFVVYFSVFSPEAAQVLLKSLEEPAPNTTVIFLSRYPYLVPQTVRSRLLIINEAIKRSERKLKDILSEIQKEAAEKDDDAATRRSRALILLDALESAVSANARSADTVYHAKSMLLKANLPTKFVLDYVGTVIR
jgi:DNA polymerase III delta prime subunit